MSCLKEKLKRHRKIENKRWEKYEPKGKKRERILVSDNIGYKAKNT